MKVKTMVRDYVPYVVLILLNICLFITMVALAAGCSIVTKNHGEVGLRYGTELSFYHNAADTHSKAEIKTGVDKALLLRKHDADNDNKDSNTTGRP